MSSTPCVARPDRPVSPLPTFQNVTAFTGINGVPFGGIGAGCLELTPDGRLANFCTNNNRHRHDRIETMPGSFLAFAASDGERGGLKLLQTESSLPLGPTGKYLLLHDGDISYDGLYPRAAVSYDSQLFPLELSLVAHGTVVPGDLVSSSLPAAVFTFTVKNTGHLPAWGALVFSWENIAGCLHGVFPEGRDNMRLITAGERIIGLECPAPAQGRPNQRGSHALYLDAPASAVVTAARYNTWELGSMLAQVEDGGQFDAGCWEQRFFSESRFTGALACKVALQPGEACEITFVLAWYYPEYVTEAAEMVGKQVGICDMGHQYANHFSDVHAVARNVLARRAEIRAGIDRWHAAVLNSSLPDWLGRMLINNLYVLSPGTLWAKDGRYSLMETPFGPMMGTLDQRFYSSVATALFFPELEREEMALFAITKHPEDRGRVYHDLGNLRFDDPKTGTTAKLWTDLNPKFVMMACRNYQWSNDRAELERLWPYITEMMTYSLAQDTDGDSLPNNEDRSTTYDDWAFFGANSYAAGIWIGALAAFRRMAVSLGREEDWLPYAPVYDTAVQAFEARLWDEELGYYRLYNDDRNPVFAEGTPEAVMAMAIMADGAVNQGGVPACAMNDHPRINRDCHDGQLAGQWYADMLGLGKLFDPAHIRRAVQQIYRRNATLHGVRKGVTPEGQESANPPSSYWWSEAGHCWPGYEVGHYAALAIYQGEVADPLTTVERLYQDIHVAGGLTWNQPLRWNVDAGATYGWGCDRYMNSPAVWHVYLALAGLVLDRPARHLALRPRLLPEVSQMTLPLFTPGNWGQLTVQEGTGTRTITVSFDHPERVQTLTVEAQAFTQVAVHGIAVPYTVEAATYGSTPELTICFASEATIGAEAVVITLA